jgi:hypothetical protein
MSLADTERAFLELCCAPEAPAASAVLDAEHAKVWGIYRSMVRQRLLNEAKTGLRRTLKAVGDDAFAAMFARWMTDAPPRSRAYYAVVPELAAFATVYWSDHASASVPAWASDLVRYEGERYRLMDIVARRDRALVDFDFERPVILHDAMSLLAVDHKVHREPDAHGRYERGRTELCLYRDKDERIVSSYALDSFNADCLRAWQQGATVSASVRAVATARGVEPSRHIESLCTVLSDLIERGVVLGSQP